MRCLNGGSKYKFCKGMKIHLGFAGLHDTLLSSLKQKLSLQLAQVQIMRRQIWRHHVSRQADTVLERSRCILWVPGRPDTDFNTPADLVLLAPAFSTSE